MDACTSTNAGTCDAKQCDWLVDVQATLGVVWGGSEKATRGWGNSFSYLRNLHELAAMLGRRLLVHPVKAYVPSPEGFMLGGQHSWAMPDVGEYLRQPGAHAVQESDVRAALGVPLGFKQFERAANRSGVKFALVRYLATMQQRRHLWLNLSKEAYYVLTKAAPCPNVPHAGLFLRCLGQLITRPVGGLRPRYAAIRSRLERLGVDSGNGTSGGKETRYVGVHVRTFGADMGVPRNHLPNPQAALEFLAWEVQVNTSEYAAAIHRLCRPGSLPIYVASDSRAAVRLFEDLCPGRIVHQYTWSIDEAASRLPSASHPLPTTSALKGVVTLRSTLAASSMSLRSARSRNVSEGGGGGFLLDWYTLANAYAIVRWGAQHSSFSKSANVASCQGRLWRSPKTWKYKAATSWLLSKLRFHHAKTRHNASYDCASTIAPMLRTIGPCSSGCVKECMLKVYAAFT